MSDEPQHRQATFTISIPYWKTDAEVAALVEDIRADLARGLSNTSASIAAVEVRYRP